MQRLLPPPEVPVLNIVSNAIPTFNIPKTEQPKKPAENFSQESLFSPVPSKPPPRLGDWLEDNDDDGAYA